MKGLFHGINVSPTLKSSIPKIFDPQKFDPQKFEPRNFEPKKFESKKIEPKKFELKTFEPRKFEPAYWSQSLPSEKKSGSLILGRSSIAPHLNQYFVILILRSPRFEP